MIIYQIHDLFENDLAGNSLEYAYFLKKSPGGHHCTG